MPNRAIHPTATLHQNFYPRKLSTTTLGVRVAIRGIATGAAEIHIAATAVIRAVAMRVVEKESRTLTDIEARMDVILASLTMKCRTMESHV
jgi:uncharacterized membrane protein